MSLPEPGSCFETDAYALAQAWDLGFVEPERGLDAANAVVARSEPRIALLSRAYEAVCLAAVRSRDVATRVKVDAAVAELAAAGWARAQRLADVALALIEFQSPLRTHLMYDRLRAHGDAAADPRPPAERFWTETALGNILVQFKRYDEALAVAQRADALAQAAGLVFMQARSAQTLIFLLLSAGDVDSAAALLPRVLGEAVRTDLRPVGMFYNLLLTHVLVGRSAAAAELIERHDWLLEPARLEQRPALRCVIALVRSQCGAPQAALALLGEQPPWAENDNPATAANRAWMSAAVWLAAGQPQRARAQIESFLATPAAGPELLSPLNATQLHRVLSEACEALGDLRGSLEALKRSQASCVGWVGTSMRSRLQALHLGAPASSEAVHGRRLSAVGEAVALARAEGAAEATARQSRYFAQVTHEMRNPINGVIGLTSLLMLSRLDETQRRQLKLAKTAAQMLLALCNDVLDLAKIEAGKFELQRAPVDVAAALREAASVFKPMADQKGLAFTLRIDPALPRPLVCDRQRLQQVVLNLLGNAIKFTEAGAVALRADWAPGGEGGAGTLTLEVSDTGIGIDAAGRSRLFQEFVQTGAGAAQGQGGSGLGLAMCRSLLALMGGSIAVDSEPGCGSRFCCTLPLAPLAEGEAAFDPAAQPAGRSSTSVRMS
ncbi:MAG: hypothetical protein KGN16_02335 [Burkholderiales bacterium]|nr:hypothetical protein [Burkholderiales bacterium]